MLKNALLVFLWLSILNGFLLARTFVEEFRIGQAGKNPGEFINPSAVAVSQEGILFVVDAGNNRLQLFDLQGRFLKTVGGFGFEADQFDRPLDIWLKSLINIYVADYNNQRVQRYDRRMNYIAQFASQPNWPEEFRFGQVLSCAVNSQNDLFVLDYADAKVVKFDRNGWPERVFGLYDSGPGQLFEPVQLDILNNKWLLVSDVGRKAVLVFDFFGNLIKVLEDSRFDRPRGLATNRQGDFWVVDEGAQKIFSVGSDLKTVTPWNFVLQKALSAPRDAAVYHLNQAKRCVILDGNQLIFGRIETHQ
ncbi:NHL repeat-containing protein [Calditrichota bacterium LG25]